MDCELLRDHSAHRDAHEVDAIFTELVDQAEQIAREDAHRERLLPEFAVSNAAVVHGDDPMIAREIIDLRLPELFPAPEAHHEEDRLAGISMK